MSDNGTRGPSQPAAGAVRAGIAVTMAEIIMRLVYWADPGLATTLDPHLVIVATGLFAAFGKHLRNRGYLAGEII